MLGRILGRVPGSQTLAWSYGLSRLALSAFLARAEEPEEPEQMLCFLGADGLVLLVDGAFEMDEADPLVYRDGNCAQDELWMDRLRGDRVKLTKISQAEAESLYPSHWRILVPNTRLPEEVPSSVRHPLDEAREGWESAGSSTRRSATRRTPKVAAQRAAVGGGIGRS